MSVRKVNSFPVKFSLSQDHVRFTTWRSENMRSSLHNEGRERAGS
jgi:hypothetical protein